MDIAELRKALTEIAEWWSDYDAEDTVASVQEVAADALRKDEP